VLPGLAVGYLVSGRDSAALFWWGLLTAILSSLAIGALSRRAQLKEDSAIGIIFAGMLALGIALISSVRSYSVDLTHFLFGNVLGVGRGDLWLTALFGAAVVLTILLFYKEFLVVSFDPTLAATLRLPVGLFYYLMLVLIATAIMVAVQTVGVGLMLAMLVTPATSAYLLTRRLPAMMALAALIGAASGVVGLYLSYYVNIASGAAIVLVATACFLLAFTFAPGRRWVWRLRGESDKRAE
jgi:manganese/iron transport system permease protein